MRLTSSGRLGLGTTSPAGMLHVKGLAGTVVLDGNPSSSVNLNFTSNSGPAWDATITQATFASNNVGLLFTVGNSNVAKYTHSFDGYGNVGIGTAYPRARLEVKGDIQFGNAPTFGSNAGIFHLGFTGAGTPVSLVPVSGGHGGTSLLVMVHCHGALQTSYHGLHYINVNFDGSLDNSGGDGGVYGVAVSGAANTFDVSGGVLRIVNPLNGWGYTIVVIRNDI